MARVAPSGQSGPQREVVRNVIAGEVLRRAQVGKRASTRGREETDVRKAWRFSIVSRLAWDLHEIRGGARAAESARW